MSKLQNRMLSSFTSAQSLTSSSCDSPGDVMATSRDPVTLREAWLKWRDVTSREGQLRQEYQEFVELSNTAAKENGYRDYSQFWRQSQFFHTSDLDRQVKSLWRDTRP